MAANEARCYRPLDLDAFKKVSGSKDASSSARKSIRISEYGEVLSHPDRAKLIVTCESIKETAASALESVTRRQNYILQTLKANKVPQGSISVHEQLINNGDVYRAATEIETVFKNLVTAEKVSNHLVLKLDGSVAVAPLIFYHSVECMENARRQASINAIRNARIKALTMAQFLNQLLGPCIGIEENEIAESAVENDGELLDQHSLLQSIRSKTLRLTVKISAEFLIRHQRTKSMMQSGS